jgi:hypothetical protein
LSSSENGGVQSIDGAQRMDVEGSGSEWVGHIECLGLVCSESQRVNIPLQSDNYRGLAKNANVVLSNESNVERNTFCDKLGHCSGDDQSTVVCGCSSCLQQGIQCSEG